MSSSGDITTEEYLGISNKLLGNYPDDIQTIVSLTPNDSADDSVKGTLLIFWEI